MIRPTLDAAALAERMRAAGHDARETSRPYGKPRPCSFCSRVARVTVYMHDGPLCPVLHYCSKHAENALAECERAESTTQHKGE